MPSGGRLVAPNFLGSNAIINGDCQISQIRAVNTNSTVALAGGLFDLFLNADMFALSGLYDATVRDSQRSDHPFLGDKGYCKSLETSITTGAAPTAGQFITQYCSVEGYIFSQLFDTISSLSFWIKSPKAGIHCVAFTNAVDRSFVREFLVYAANTWQQVTVSVPFDETTGTWNFTNGVGVRIIFPYVAGANFITTPNAWRNGVFLATVNQQNLADTVGNTLRITDVNLNFGVVAQPFARVPFDVALQRCQRYYWQSAPYGTTPQNSLALGNGELYWMARAGAAAQQSASFVLPTTMRAQPTFSTFAPVVAGVEARNITRAEQCTNTAILPATNATGSFYVNSTGSASQAANDVIAAQVAANARI